MAVFKDCHQRLPKFCWSDGCLYRLSSNTAQSSAEVMAVFKDCLQTLPKVLLKWWLSSKTKDCPSSAEVMAVFTDYLQTLPKVLLKWWLSLKTVIKHCPKFCWSDGCHQRLPSKTAPVWRLSSKDCPSSAEVMAVFKDCLQQVLQMKTREKTADTDCTWKSAWKILKYILFLSWALGTHLWIWQPSRHFVRVGRSKLW